MEQIKGSLYQQHVCFCNPSARAESHQQERARKLCSATLIAKRTKSKNRMQITEFLARLGQHERVLREIQEI